MENRKDTFCITAFSAILVRADATVSLCCFNSGSAKNKQGEKVYLYRDSFRDSFHSDFFQEVRASLKEGRRHPSCETCWRAEDSGFVSKRQYDNQGFAHLVEKIKMGSNVESPVQMNLNLGSLCNLKCRICGPTSSSRWAAEYIDLYGSDHVPRENDFIRNLSQEDSRSLLVNWPNQSQEFKETMREWIPAAAILSFLGGEPFLSTKQFELTKYAVEVGAASKQILEFTTNGTIFPEEAMREVWPHFSKVYLNVSVDGLYEQFEYQRYGARWNKVQENIRRYRASKLLHHLEILVSVSVFSVFDLPRSLEFWQKENLPVGLSFVSNPHRFDVRVLPAPLKRLISEKYSSCDQGLSDGNRLNLFKVRDFMNSADLSELWPKTKESIAFHDSYRQEKFAEVFSEFYKIAKSLGFWT